jgi:hypothetical protein
MNGTVAWENGYLQLIWIIQFIGSLVIGPNLTRVVGACRGGDYQASSPIIIQDTTRGIQYSLV